VRGRGCRRRAAEESCQGEGGGKRKEKKPTGSSRRSGSSRSAAAAARAGTGGSSAAGSSSGLRRRECISASRRETKDGKEKRTPQPFDSSTPPAHRPSHSTSSSFASSPSLQPSRPPHLHRRHWRPHSMNRQQQQRKALFASETKRDVDGEERRMQREPRQLR